MNIFPLFQWEQRVDKGKDDFEKMSQVVRREVARFDRNRVEDFKNSIIRYLEHLMENQQKVIIVKIICISKCTCPIGLGAPCLMLTDFE